MTKEQNLRCRDCGAFDDHGLYPVCRMHGTAANPNDRMCNSFQEK